MCECLNWNKKYSKKRTRKRERLYYIFEGTNGEDEQKKKQKKEK